ncbi:hypothetical protein BO443_60010 [Burkholderia orbicola]
MSKSRWPRRTAAITISPASVNCMPRGSRSNSGTPTCSSRLRICWCTAAAVRCSASAALRIEPRRATSSKQRNVCDIERMEGPLDFFEQGVKNNPILLTGRIV